MFTLATPASNKPISFAAALVKSMIRLLTYGPRSLIRTTTNLLFERLVTFSFVPKGRDLWAAVFLFCRYISPLAVVGPS